MISQSKMMKNELINMINEKGGHPINSPSIPGSLHRTWIDIKNSFTIGNIEESTLSNVVFGEQAAMKIYQAALESGDLCHKSTELVKEQLNSLKVSHEQFKKIEEYKSQ
ncbi:DUF2383 domain-containing protein [Chryseobacterium wangxinyae]|nr:DUF2383 domain-containing protein [Chryseobacterium sp. CY350]WBZ96914.1 DUF2383 domain-containing protein [Chryseobacterium sp. CY350]